MKGPESEFLLYCDLDISSEVRFQDKVLMAKTGSEGVVMGYETDNYF